MEERYGNFKEMAGCLASLSDKRKGLLEAEVALSAAVEEYAQVIIIIIIIIIIFIIISIDALFLPISSYFLHFFFFLSYFVQCFFPRPSKTVGKESLISRKEKTPVFVSKKWEIYI